MEKGYHIETLLYGVLITYFLVAAVSLVLRVREHFNVQFLVLLPVCESRHHGAVAGRIIDDQNTVVIVVDTRGDALEDFLQGAFRVVGNNQYQYAP
jgi:hypothetical protein